MLKILSWNIRQGGGSRLSKITNAIANYDAKILAFSEFRNNQNGALLKQNLMSLGFMHTANTPSQPDANSVLIVSKLPFETVIYHNCDETYTYNIVTVVFSAFNVMAVYLPHKKHHKLFDFINALVRADDKPYIIVGDYNTGINYLDQTGNSFWYSDALMQLNEAEYVDAFRLKHGDKKEYSWYSHQGNGYRYDHTYVHKSIEPLVIDCFYLHEWREQGLSDHSPMILSLG